MRDPRCSFCGAKADYSVALILSTLRISPRQQRTGKGTRLCNACIQKSIRPSEAPAPFVGCDALSDVYTGLAERFKRQPNLQNGSGEPA